MLNCLRISPGRRMQLSARCGLLLIVTLAMVVGFFQSGCKKKNKVTMTPVTGVRIAILPFNIPSGNQELRWTAMAGAIMTAKVSEYSKDIEVVPLWQTMPIAIEAAGPSRSITPDAAAYIASWLAVKWSAMGEISPAKSGVSLMVDFIPARSTQIPFRFNKSGNIDDVGSKLPTAFNQFLYYLAAKRLEPINKQIQTMTEMKGLAEALDREYGWFAEASPGKAKETVAKLASSDERLARLLFSPSLYPELAPTK